MFVVTGSSLGYKKSGMPGVQREGLQISGFFGRRCSRDGCFLGTQRQFFSSTDKPEQPRLGSNSSDPFQVPNLLSFAGRANHKPRKAQKV